MQIDTTLCIPLWFTTLTVRVPILPLLFLPLPGARDFVNVQALTTWDGKQSATFRQILQYTYMYTGVVKVEKCSGVILKKSLSFVAITIYSAPLVCDLSLPPSLHPSLPPDHLSLTTLTHLSKGTLPTSEDVNIIQRARSIIKIKHREP